MKKLVSLSASLLLAVSCASTNVVKLNGKSYPAKPENCEIEILSQTPSKKFEEIAMLNARGGQSMMEGKSVQDLIPDMKKKACLQGGDAIVIKDSKEGGYNFGGPADRAQANATVIKYIN